jgi:plasmid stabilization system protein ParE
VTFIVRETATNEAIEAWSWYAERNTEAANGFARALRAAFTLIRTSPQAGRIVLGNRRRVLVMGYRYSIIYFIQDADVVVVAVAHTSRKPGYWRGRR